MADNITLDSGTGGATLAADDITSVWYQIIKLAFGALDTATLVTTSAGLPVDIRASNATVTVDLAGNNDVTIDASSIVLAEDVAHSTGDAGVQMLAVRKATPADLSGADGDYEPLQLDNGRLWTSTTIDAALPSGTNAIGKLAANSGVDIGDVDIIGSALTALQLIDNPVAVLGTATYTETSSSGMIVGAVRNDALAALAGTDNEIAPLQVDEDGGLWTHPAAGPAGGCKGFFSNDLDQTEEDIATAACTVYGIYAWNATAAPLWLQIFNTNTVTVGTTAPTFNFIIPGNADSDGAGVVIPIPVQGLAFSTALTMAITTGVGTNNGAPGANDAGVFVTYQD
ncbi:hypothetical protein LCGC14_0382750 [marine sediment metagenome]|uniref:Uncharacterized protein n=1 Tax=marine sediment metagenome TaxID=412755 RepID=A0A0F9VP99_9ZZZZ